VTDATPNGSAVAVRWRRQLATSLTLVALGVLAGYLVQNRHYLAEHFAPRPGAFLAIAVLLVATLVVRAGTHQVLFGRLGITASAGDWFRLVTVSSFTNYLPLSAGLVAKAYFLKRVHSLPYGTFALGQLVMLVMIVATNGAVGLVTLAIALPHHLFGIVGAGFALMLTAMLPLLMPASVLRWRSRRFTPWDADAATALRRAWPTVAVLQLGNLLASAGTLQIAFAMGPSPVGFAACLVFTAAAMLTRFVAITPGAIGIREFLIGGLAYLTGFELRDAVIASTVTRTVEIVVVFALGGAFTHRLSAQVASTYDDPD
jgi:uncharacterized membrane protein YbhN (UPF0104 family)